jgi:hypothetical protein
MAGDILDTPTDPNIDISSGFADIRGALDFAGDVDVLRIDMADRNSFSTGAWKIEGRESLKFRVLDAAGQEVQGAVVDSEGSISLVGSAKGQYSLEISSPTGEMTEYNLRVSAWTAEPPTFPEVTPRPDDADEIGPDATILDTSNGYAWTDGEILGKGDKDVFAFEMLQTGPVQIFGSAYRVENAGFKIALFDAAGLQYGEGDQGNLIETRELKAGKYYLVVSDVSGESVGYSLVITSQLRADGGPDGRVPDSGVPDIGAPGDGVPDSKSPDDPDIQLYLKDGIWFYGDDSIDGDRRADGIEDPTVCPFPLVDWDGDQEGSGDNDGNSDDLGKDDSGKGISLLTPAPIFERMHNTKSPADVDGDDSLTPLDALILINMLNSRGGGAVSSFVPSAVAQRMAPEENSFLDTNNDGFVSPLDVLIVINQLNLQTARDTDTPIAGESETDNNDSVYAAAVDWAFASGEDDEDKSGLWCVLPVPELN